MGTLDDSRSTASAFAEQMGQCITQLQAGSQRVAQARQGFRGRLGRTNHPKISEAEAHCAAAVQKLAEATAALAAARKAAEDFRSSLT